MRSGEICLLPLRAAPWAWDQMNGTAPVRQATTETATSVSPVVEVCQCLQVLLTAVRPTMIAADEVHQWMHHPCASQLGDNKPGCHLRLTGTLSRHVLQSITHYRAQMLAVRLLEWVVDVGPTWTLTSHPMTAEVVLHLLVIMIVDAAAAVKASTATVGPVDRIATPMAQLRAAEASGRESTMATAVVGADIQISGAPEVEVPIADRERLRREGNG